MAPDLDYGNLQVVEDGTAAQFAYLEAIDGQTAETRRNELSQILLESTRPCLFSVTLTTRVSWAHLRRSFRSSPSLASRKRLSNTLPA